MTSIKDFVAVDFFQGALSAVSAFVVTLDQHPFGALVLIVLLVAIVTMRKRYSLN